MCSLSEYDQLRNRLVEAGLLIPSGVPGIYGRAGVFEAVIEGFERLVTQAGRDLSGVEVMRFPPIFPRAVYEKLSHVHQFPDLLGSIHTFTGDQKAARRMSKDFLDGADWTEHLVPAQAMMIPAACYPLFPTATGTLTEEGRIVDLRSYVFRHEPSPDPARMQIFRQREYVRLGTAEQVLDHRNMWLDRGEALLKSLGLPVRRELANDPFFGRGGKLAAATQREQALKYELVCPIASHEKPTAISSSNIHTDYFGVAFDIKTADGQPAHSACIGFGLERIALALFSTHGLDVDDWSAEVRDRLL